MAEPDAGGRGGGDRVAAAAVVPRREAVVDGAGEAVRAAGGVEACATAPEGGGRFDDGKKAFGAEERQLGDSAESISVRLEGGDHMGEGKKDCSEERLGSTEEEKRGLFHVELRDSPESGNLATCHVVNGGVWNYRLRASSGEAFGSKDVACIMHDALSKTKEGSQCELGVLVCDGGGVVNVKIRGDDLMMGGNEACGDIVGVSDLRKVDSEGSPPGADSKGSNANANCALEKEVLLPKNDEEVARLLDKASLPSISDSCFDASLDGNAGQIGDISEKSVGIEKSARDLNGGDMHFCVSGSREDRYVEENQRPSMDALHGINLFVSKAASMENFEACANGSAEIGLSLRQADQKDGSSKIPPERNLTNSSHVQSCEDSSCCSAQESSAEHHTHKHFAGVESAPLGQVEEFDVCNSADAKTCAGNFAENVNNGEPLDAKPTQLIVFRRRNPKRAASSRNTQNLEKPEQANKARNSTGKSKKVVSASSLLLSTMVKFPNKAMKRSGMNRPLQHSAWGSLQNLINSFDQKLLTSVSDLTSLGSEGSKRCSDEKQQPCIRKGRSSRFSKNKFAVPSDIGRAKDASNGQSTFPVMVDTHASSEGHKEHIPKLACDASSIDVCDEVGKTSRSNEGKYILKLKLVQTDKQQLERDLESTVTQETHTEYINGEFTRILTSEPSVKNGKGTVMLDPGSSPDSVVYNPVSEVTAATCEGNTSASCDVVVHENILVPGALVEDGVHAVVLATSNLPKNHALDSPVNLEQLAKTVGESSSTKKAEIGPSCVMLENQLDEGKMQASEKANVVTKPKSLRKQICKKKDGIKEKNRKTRSSTKVSSRKASKLRAFSNDSSLLDSSRLAVHQGSPKFDSCFEAPASSEQDLGTRLHEHETSVAPRHKKKYGHGRMKGKAGNPHVKGKNKKRGLPGDALLDHRCFSLPSQSATELAASGLNELSELSPATELALKNSTMSTKLPHKAACRLDGASVLLPLRAAWVCCDDCQKWRCIPSELADIIGETHCRWTCKDNEDKAFADCSIPQEKTNAEINAELELSDASADEANNAGSNSRACRPPSWTPIRSNLFLHRNRRTQSIDESMVCNCKLPEDGRMGCGDRCLNRILNIECVKRTCPCGDLCSNQQFQRHNYAKLRWSHSGKKGYGLQLKKNVSEGQFLIEYVGEVLDITAYESRQTHYASKGQKHFYFMALNGGEVIDACSKGNLGRFINHSCSPNCRTEKWMVNGEVCIGIFAIRNIKKGEELTFDYNYVRVSGAAPQKCFCGTAKCRGYIGGDTFVDTTAQGDAEVGYFERVTVDRDAVKELVANEFGPDVAEHEETSMQREDSNDCSSAIPDLEPCQQTGVTLSDISEPDNCLQALSPHEAEDIIHTPIHVSQPMESSVRHFPIPSTWSEEYHQKASCLLNGSRSINDTESNLVSDFNVTKENKLKHLSNPRQSCPIGNAKDSTASRETLVFHKEKKMPTDTGDGHLLGVEGRLNNLLDADGGISKRKDATNGYLKLLLVTAAEGDDAGGASKSVRDLSLILDALLKTKSHAVLLDIINKNGLQMLHNILKQNRSNFHRTPIIRKLLKVLEFLALKEILTPEHINGGPRCAGVESFKDSMLSLTRHNNSQVHQIARNFCEKWISCAIPRSGPMEREDSHLHSQRNFSNKLHAPLTNCQCGQRNRVSDATVCVDTTAHLPASSSAWDIQGVSTASGPASISTSSSDCKSTGRRKRKSRWDQPSDDHYEMVGLKVQKVCSEHGESGPQIGYVYNGVPCMSGSTAENVDDEVPPGFGSQQEHHPAQISCGGIAPGFCQERYQPHLSISYGIPVALVRHFGTPETEGQHQNRWKIAPGVPFCPFPPLPPYPRGDPCPSTSSQMSWHCDDTLAMKHSTSGHYQRSVNRDERIHRNWRNGGGMRWPSSYHARKFPRQWSNHCRIERHRPPWPREQDGLRSRGRELASSGFGNSSSNIHGNSCSPKM